MIQFLGSTIGPRTFKEVIDVNQHLYEMKQYQKNNLIQEMARVNRPKLCFIIELFLSLKFIHSC